MAGTFRITAAALLALLQLLSAGAVSARVDSSEEPAAHNAAYGKLPLAFVSNAGQADSRVRFEARTAGASFFFARTKAVFAFARGDKGVALELSFVGANRSPRIEGVGVQPGAHNYLIGNDPSQWQTGLRSYRDVVYREVWPGIDVAFRGDRSKLKYEFRLAPGADVSDIRLRYGGAERLSIAPTRELRIHTGLGVLRDSRPVTYQVVEGARLAVESKYTLAPSRTAYGFSVGTYDRSRPLVIDPGLAYSALLGSSFSDIGRAVAVDGGGNAYVVGVAGASNFPTSVGAFDTSYNTGGSDVGSDVFVTKLNPSGSALVYSTFLGGSGGEDGNGVAVDDAGSAVVSGRTSSLNFPATAGALDTTFNGGFNGDAFVTKLNPDGSGLVYSTYIGGSADESGNGIALDAGGNAVVAGQTTSTNFPVTPGALDTALGGGGDAFVTKLDPVGSVLYSTFLGSPVSGGETGNAIAVDDGGNAYVTGFAGLGFPVTAGAFDTSYNETGDAFVSKLNAAGSTLIYSTYLGTGGSDHGNGIAVDAAGNAHVAGRTGGSTFPTTTGAFDTTYNGGLDDAFATKLDASGSSLLYSTYLGSFGIDWARAITVDETGVAHVAGFTDGSNFPTVAGAFDTSFNGGFDAFVTRLAPAGSTLFDSTFLGGTGHEQAYGIAVDGAGNAYVTGSTNGDFPTTAGALNRGNGSNDVFVTKLATATPNQPPVVDAGPDASTGEGQAFASSGAFTDTGSTSWTATVDYGDGSGVQSLALSGNTFPLGHSYDDNGVYTVTVSVTDNQGATGSDTAVVTVTNVAPTASFVAESPIFEGGSSGVSFSEASDPSGADTAAGFRYTFACDGVDSSLASSYSTAGTDASASCSYADDGTYVLKGRILDKDDGATTYDPSVLVQNVAPAVGTIVAPADPVSVGTVVDASAPFADPGTLDTHTAVVDWGDGATSLGTVTEANGSGTATGSHVYTVPGVYTLALTVADDDGGAGQSFYRYVVVYDPDGSSVRGRGTILSPAGAYVADPSLTGEAVFGFQSRYKNGATVPSGRTRFRFKLAGFTFVSRDYDWLVAAGARAQFKGTGEVNGSGSYAFLLTAVDGDVSGGGGADRFRIKIWDKTTGDVVYDNQLGSPDDADPQALLDGSIVIR